MGEPMRAYEAGQELLCRPPSNSNASGTPAARLVPACTSMCSQGSSTRGYTTSPRAWAAGLACALSPVNSGSAGVCVGTLGFGPGVDSHAASNQIPLNLCPVWEATALKRP